MSDDVPTVGAAPADDVRRVVVSGGGTGIGRAIARAFALDEAVVTIIGRREDVLSETADELNNEVGREAVRHVASTCRSRSRYRGFATRSARSTRL
jgi:short-subunit dehydrogenase